MKKTDMELQAIRDKLQLLEAEPPAAETLSLPWSARRLIEPNQPPSTDRAALQQHLKQSPQAIAIEALKQRSGNALLNAQKQGQGNSTEALSQAENLIAKELYKLEIQAHNINVRSQQQAEDIISMKRAAQQAIFELSKQGIHDHPDLAAIAELFDSDPSAAVPHIERDGQGHFSLTYNTIDINSAHKDAIATANTLRQLAGNGSPRLFAEPIIGNKTAHRTPLSNSSAGRSLVVSEETLPGEKDIGELTKVGAGERCKTFILNIVAGINKTGRKHSRKRRSSIDDDGFHPGFNELTDDETHDEASRLEDFYTGSGFSWLDGAIWFSGAAIARIAIELAVVNYPWLATPLLIGLVGTIIFVIYRVLSSQSSDYTAAYRLFIAMLGLFSVGLF